MKVCFVYPILAEFVRVCTEVELELEIELAVCRVCGLDHQQMLRK